MARKKSENIRPGDTVTVDHVVLVVEIRKDVVLLHMVDGSIVERPRTMELDFVPEDTSTVPPIPPTHTLPAPGPVG